MNWEDILWELVQMIESAAPKAWEIALRQVQTMYVKSLLGGGLLTACGIASAILFTKLAYGRDKDWYNSEYLAGHIFTLILLIPGILILIDCIGYGMNPEYYAIRALTDLVNISQ